MILKGWKGVACMWAEVFSSVKMAEQNISKTLGQIESSNVTQVVRKSHDAVLY